MGTQDTEPKLAVQTPEQVEFEYELAGLGSRFLAFLFDGLIRLFFNLVLFILFFAALIIVGLLQGEVFSCFKRIFGSSGDGSNSPVLLFAVIWFIFWLLNTGYYIFFETLWSGQSPGKKLLNLRVIREGGYPVGFYEAAIRNLLRIIDLLPINYLVGALCVFISPREKRVGDYAAGTIVIKEKTTNIPGAAVKDGQQEREPQAIKQVIPNLVNVKRREYNMIVEFLERREEMDSSHRKQVAQTLAGSLVKKLRIDVPEGMSFEDFLSHFAALYRREMKFL